MRGLLFHFPSFWTHEVGEESILFKTNFDYCFTPSSRSFRFAIRKTFIHFCGTTSNWVRVAHTASYAKSVLDFLHEKQSFIQFLNSADFDYSGSRFSWLHFQTSSLSFRRKTPTYEFRSLRSTSLYRNPLRMTEKVSSYWGFSRSIFLL